MNNMRLRLELMICTHEKIESGLGARRDHIRGMSNNDKLKETIESTTL
jgi:hypothetical protein